MPEEESVEETKSGVKKKGDWEEISEFAREAEKVIEDGDVDEESVKKYGRWRPREKEDKEDLKEKTVEEAQLQENKLEKESNGMKEDIGEASHKAVKASKKLKDGEAPSEDVKKASQGLIRPFYTEFAEKFRALESFIYSNIMLRLNPYYFDSGDISADVAEEKSGEYEMNVNVTEEGTRGKLKEEFDADNG
ncbi:MAG: DUF5828 family protein [Candidatus Nanohalobium sp.]